MQIRFTGGDGCSYAIETSSNLSNWTAFGTTTASGGIFQFTEPTLNSNRRFYRSVLLPLSGRGTVRA